MLTIKEYRTLVNEMAKHAVAYYVEDKPSITDQEYDKKYKLLEAFEAKHPGEILADSPTQYVAPALPENGLKKVTRRVPMLSLDNSYTLEDVNEFLIKLDDPVDFVVSPKYDGLAIDLSYEQGLLADATTRGDGLIGESVIHNVRDIMDIPKYLQYADTVFVRGEVFLSSVNWEKIAEEGYTDPRNAAAGILRSFRKSSKAHLLSFRAYGVLHEFDDNPAISHDKINFLYENDFPCDFNLCETREDAIVAIEAMRPYALSSGIPIDGAVVVVGDERTQDKLGFTNKHPRFALAYKYETVKYHTTLLDVVLQTGRTGKVTPVAVLKPVKVGNVMVDHANLCNQDQIDRLGIEIGDEIIIHRAGEVIPQIIGLHEKGKDSTPIPRITHCPSCREKVYTRLNMDGTRSVDLYCENKACPSVFLRTLEAHVSRKCANIMGFGESLIKDLVETGKVKSVEDIYYLTVQDFKEVGLSDHMARKKWGAIASAMESTPAVGVLCSLGIPELGNSASKALLKGHKGSIDKSVLMNMAVSKGMETIADNIKTFDGPIDEILCQFASTDRPTDTLDDVATNHVGNLNEDEVKKFVGKRIGITGSFPIKRDTITARIADLMANVVNIGKKTDLVLVGENPGTSKVNRIESNGIKVITLKDLGL